MIDVRFCLICGEKELKKENPKVEADKELGFSFITAYDLNTRDITDLVGDIERRIGYDKMSPVYIR
jgi:hypothetical protein